LNFFHIIHRSIFEPEFYKDTVVSANKKFVAGYVLKLLIFSALIISAAQLYYLFDEQRGLASPMEAAFHGMEIIDGKLDPGVQTPYILPNYLIFPVLQNAFGIENAFATDSDSMFIVDTASQIQYSLKVPVILMKKDEIVFLFNSMMSFPAKYSDLLGGEKDFKFDKESINSFLRKNRLGLLQLFFFKNFTTNFFTLIFSIILLGGAAFIFRVEKRFVFTMYLKTAVFAVTPILVGNILIALSGVQLAWPWHVLIFISTVVMFRALVAMGTSSEKPNEVL